MRRRDGATQFRPASTTHDHGPMKAGLINSPIDNGADCVETHQGVVTLSGRVTSKDEEAKAITLARTVKGVTDVKSALQIQ